MSEWSRERMIKRLNKWPRFYYRILLVKLLKSVEMVLKDKEAVQSRRVSDELHEMKGERRLHQ